jgi:hypothetical protein
MFLRKKELISKTIIYTNDISSPIGMKYPRIRTAIIEEYWKTKWFWQSDYNYEYIYEISQNINAGLKDAYDNDKSIIQQAYLDEEYLAKLYIINRKYNNKSLNNTNID